MSTPTADTAASDRSLRGLLLLLATIAGVSVANIYYNQPLLDSFRASFPDGASWIGAVPTATQLGYAAGMFLLAPLGDRFDRRGLILLQIAGLSIALIAAAAAPSLVVLAFASLAIGILATIAQQAVPFAAEIAPPAERGHAVGTVMSGLLLGILLARTVSSFVGGLWGWRAIFFISAALMLALAVVLYRTLPQRPPSHTARYGSLLRSVLDLARSEPALRRRAACQALLFGAFSAFWTAIAYELIDEHGFTQSQIALFALVGAGGAAAAPLAGRLADRGHGPLASGGALACSDAAPAAAYRGMRLVHLPAARKRSLETLSHTTLSIGHLLTHRRPDAAIVFNAANAPLLPALRAARIPVATHVDGLEWKRAKWGPVGRRYYRVAETLAVRWSDLLIADAQGIADYYSQHGVDAELIAYGAPILDGDLRHRLRELDLAPQGYHLVVARFEAENHVDLIVQGYVRSRSTKPLVVVGSAPYAEEYSARVRDAADDRVRFLGGVWDQRLLDQLYANAATYLHGHSVGGTNPSLLRAMGAGSCVLALDTPFNREALGDAGYFFARDPNAVAALVDAEGGIEDRSSRVLAFSGRQDEADPSRVETIIGRQVPERYARRLTELGVFRELYREQRPVVVDPARLDVDAVSKQRVAIAVRAGDEVLGSIWAAMDGPLTEERSATLRDATKLVALHLLRIRAGADAQRSLRAELVSRALDGGPDAQDALGRLGLAGRRVWVMATALAPRGEDGTEHDSIAERERLTDALALHLSAVQQGAAVALVGDTVYGILPVADAAAEDRSVRLAEDFLQRVGDRIPAVIGIGRPAATVAEIARSRAEAHRALRVVVERAPRQRSLARIADVETDSLLLDLRDLRSARGDLASGPLARLIDYDTRHDAHLVDTLTAWLDHFGDVTAAAAACFVHANTFRYRLRRVAEVGRLDLDDADARFAAMLEIRTLPVR